MPFFAEHRLLLIEDSGFFKNANQQLAEYIPSIPEETIMLFVESEVDKRGKLYKAVSKNEQTLTRWILGILKTEGKMITSGAMKQFLEKTGTDMERIRQELEKLICYCMEKESLTEEDVAVICSEQTENKIFDMINAMAEKKQKKAMELYYDLLALKEPPMRILYLITRQFNLLMQVKELSEEGYSAKTISERLKMSATGRILFTENLKRSSAGLRQDGRGSQNRAYERCDERGASACQIFELIRVFLPSK